MVMGVSHGLLSLYAGSVTAVPALESTQQEADTRVILYSIYSVQNEQAERVIIYANDTDIITTWLYYAATHLKDLPEFWVRTAHDVYLPIHEMAVARGLSQCHALPFVHSLSGRDTTSYPYFMGKKSWIKASTTVDLAALESFGKDATDDITPNIIKEARDLTIAVYTTRADSFEESDLAKLRTYKFLNNRSTLLKLLPPTENAFLLHLKRAALATIIDKNGHMAKPDLPQYMDFRWSMQYDSLFPVPATKPPWPQDLRKAMSCHCIKGCKRNCSCSKKDVPCYEGCRCQGLATKCSRVQYTDTMESSDSRTESETD
ncbi:uncharacterized protein LOC117511756 [Thalassophryne amazonica]|uniref:uncharacterized protein LOC117511756 n=1 Tax=Thalassophryne amazonica TaxID=390379 RepID=UPI0014709DF5|nr:uncharacterized protein LOC117511756 [Thalassophryne amazonica]